MNCIIHAAPICTLLIIEWALAHFGFKSNVAKAHFPFEPTLSFAPLSMADWQVEWRHLCEDFLNGNFNLNGIWFQRSRRRFKTISKFCHTTTSLSNLIYSLPSSTVFPFCVKSCSMLTTVLWTENHGDIRHHGNPPSSWLYARYQWILVIPGTFKEFRVKSVWLSDRGAPLVWIVSSEPPPPSSALKTTPFQIPSIALFQKDFVIMAIYTDHWRKSG